MSKKAGVGPLVVEVGIVVNKMSLYLTIAQAAHVVVEMGESGFGDHSESNAALFTEHNARIYFESASSEVSTRFLHLANQRLSRESDAALSKIMAQAAGAELQYAEAYGSE